jgi:acyl-CoA synthetase (AMP-forming)/AMP-acid ligase II
VVRQSEDLDAGAVIDFVARQVALYKRVRQVEFVGTIPKSASGKVLKRLLRSPAAV